MLRTSLLVTFAVAALAASSPLGPYTVDPSMVSVGGLSAGGFMAVQYHLAYSAELLGAAVFAGGPWYCAQGEETTALTTCMDPLLSKPNPKQLADMAASAAAKGDLDPLSNVGDARVFLYSGSFDTVVHRPVMTALQGFYELLVNSTGTITTAFDVPSEHCYPTLDFGESCSSLGSPYIGKCNFDGAGAGLKTIYSSLNARGTAVAANLMEFDQTAFGTGSSLGDTGYIYVPTACQSGTTCKLHIAFHGCQQTLADIGTDFVSKTGLNDWAESNNMIVLYPQVKKSDVFPSNPEGCFDWWGYSGEAYAYKSGKQMAFTKAIVDKIMGN